MAEKNIPHEVINIDLYHKPDWYVKLKRDERLLLTVDKQQVRESAWRNRQDANHPDRWKDVRIPMEVMTDVLLSLTRRLRSYVESLPIIELLDSLYPGKGKLIPQDPFQKYRYSLVVDTFEQSVVPKFYEVCVFYMPIPESFS